MLNAAALEMEYEGMTGKAASPTIERLLTMAPRERLSAGKNACVTLSSPTKLTASFDHFEITQIVVNRDAGIVNEDIERTDLQDCLLDLRSVGYVQSHGRHAFVGDLQRAASTCVDLLCPASKRLGNKRPHTAVRPSD